MTSSSYTCTLGIINIIGNRGVFLHGTVWLDVGLCMVNRVASDIFCSTLSAIVWLGHRFVLDTAATLYVM